MWKKTRDEMAVHALGFTHGYEYCDYTETRGRCCLLSLVCPVPDSVPRSVLFIPSRSLVALSLVWVLGSLVVLVVAAFTRRHAGIGEEGLTYLGLGKKINASWPQVVKVRLEGNRCATVFTEEGKFHITAFNLKPTDGPPLPFFDPDPTALQYYTELLEELRQRTSNAQWTIDPVYALFNAETPGVIPEPWLPTLLWMLPFVLGTLGVLRLLAR